MNLFHLAGNAPAGSSFWQAAKQVRPAGYVAPAGDLDPSRCREWGIDESACRGAPAPPTVNNVSFAPASTAQQQQQQQTIVAGLGLASTALQGIAGIISTAITQEGLTQRTALVTQAETAIARARAAAGQLAASDPAGAASAQQALAQLQSQLQMLQMQAAARDSSGMSDTLKYGLIAAGGLLLLGGVLVIARSGRGARSNPSYRRRRR